MNNNEAFGASRRRILQAAGAAAVTAGLPQTAMAAALPKGFLWGAATAGHQVEGNNTNADMWALEHASPTLFKDVSGDACDSFSRWREDLDLVKKWD